MDVENTFTLTPSTPMLCVGMRLMHNIVKVRVRCTTAYGDTVNEIITVVVKIIDFIVRSKIKILLLTFFNRRRQKHQEKHVIRFVSKRRGQR